MVQFIHMVITVSYSNRHVSMLLFQINAKQEYCSNCITEIVCVVKCSFIVSSAN
jgi:hypothetical protein